MAINPYATSGMLIHIASAAVTTEPANAAAYAALTWTQIGNVRSYSAFGDTQNIINAPVVGDSRIRKIAGSRDAGNVSLTVYTDESDTGQLALIAAALTSSQYPIRVDYPNASKLTVGGTIAKRYFVAIVAGGKETPGGNEDIITTEWTLALTTKVTALVAT
jgi:Phage tail tube protein, TTP